MISVLSSVLKYAIELLKDRQIGFELKFWKSVKCNWKTAIRRNFKSIRIKKIQKYTPADRSKIQVGDRITHVGMLSTKSPGKHMYSTKSLSLYDWYYTVPCDLSNYRISISQKTLKKTVLRLTIVILLIWCQ